MFTKELFEDYSLFRKYNPTEFEPEVEYWRKIPINMKCFVCDSEQTFNQTSSFYNDQPNSNNGRAENRVFDVRFKCQSCRDFERRFLIYVSEDLNTIYKVGQYPEWEIKMDKNLEKTLHKHSKTYRKGLVCESQGYGIGAFAYYRRITEEIIDELLESITELIDLDNQEKYKEALEKAKKTRVTQEKIDLVKDLLPSILRPNGMNPLGVLHSELSEGLHAESDESCLENANHIKSILTFLINQIIQSKESAKNFTESMQSLLIKKSKK
jgi:hypothetical protein